MSRRKQPNPARLESAEADMELPPSKRQKTDLGDYAGCAATTDSGNSSPSSCQPGTSGLLSPDEAIAGPSRIPTPVGSRHSDMPSPIQSEEGDSSRHASAPESGSVQDAEQGDMPYPCPVCGESFPKLKQLMEHEQTHMDHLQFTCSYCPRLFKHKRSRDRHTKLHTGDKKYKCQQCESAFSRSDHLKIHMKTHDSRKPYKCGTCNRGYNTAAALSSHQQSHLKQESRCGSRTSGGSTPSPGIFRCSHCSETFNKMECLQNHISSNHSDTDSPSSETPDQIISDYQPRTEEVKIVCIYCSKEFSSLDLMYQHANLVHRDVQNGNPTSVSLHSPALLSLEKEAYQNGTPTYACERCTMQFDSIQSLKEHVNSIHWNPIMTTNHSAKEFNFSDIAHNFNLETSYSPFQTQPTDLSRKRRKEDNIEKSYRKKKTDQLSPTTGHSSSFNCNDKPYICSCCYVQLPNFKSFLLHMETHMTSPNNSLLGFCPICGEPGRDPISFTNHIFGHAISQVSGRCCYVCKKTFEQFEKLQKHLLDVHTLSVYKCSLCNEISDTKLSMQLHLTNKHNEECKHFKCHLCTNQIFHDRLSAELHISRKHYQQFTPYGSSSQGMLQTKYHAELDARLMEHGSIFQCNFCQKSFKDQYSQYFHILKEHNEAKEGEKYLMESVMHHQNPSTSPSFVFPKTLSSPDSTNKIEVKCGELYTCDICKRCDIGSESELLTHKKLHQPKAKGSSVSLQCAYCNEYCKSRSDLENHMKSHQVSCGKGKHKCNICDEIYSSALTLADHKLTHCKIVDGNCCVQCKSTLTDEQSFYTHQLQHNSSPAKSNSQISLPANCIICCQTLQTDLEIKLHAKFHLKHLFQKEFRCDGCNKIFDNQSGKLSEPTSNAYLCKDCSVKSNSKDCDKYACIQCPQTFDCESEVQNHSSIHMMNEGINLECRLCKQIFSSPLKLQAHLIEHNFYGMNQYSCYVCSSVFTAASGLQNHIIGHGLESRPYECSQCQMKFFFRAELDNHRFVHIVHSPSPKCLPSTSYHLLNGVDSSSNSQYKTCKYCLNSFLDNTFFVEHLKQCQFKFTPKKENFDADMVILEKNIKKEHTRSGEDDRCTDKEEIQ